MGAHPDRPVLRQARARARSRYRERCTRSFASAGSSRPGSASAREVAGGITVAGGRSGRALGASRCRVSGIRRRRRTGTAAGRRWPGTGHRCGCDRAGRQATGTVFPSARTVSLPGSYSTNCHSGRPRARDGRQTDRYRAARPASPTDFDPAQAARAYQGHKLPVAERDATVAQLL